MVSGCISGRLLFALLLALLGIGVQPVEPAQAASAAEIASLTDFYNDLGGPGWTTNTNWVNGGDPCDPILPWHGVTCDAGGNVIEITLGSNNLAGNLDLVDLSGLTNLREVELSCCVVPGKCFGVTVKVY